MTEEEEEEEEEEFGGRSGVDKLQTSKRPQHWR